MPSNGDKPHRKVTNANGGGELILNERGVREHRGRAAGTPNRTTRILKDAILLAAERAGMPEIEHDDKGHIVSATPGEGGLDAYLLSCALYERRAFMTLLGRVLPFQLMNLCTPLGRKSVALRRTADLPLR